MEQSDQIPSEYRPCWSDLQILPAIPKTYWLFASVDLFIYQ